MMASTFTRPVTRRALHFAAAAALVLVAGTAWGEPRFSVSADSTEVTDHRTGLVWQRCSAGQSYAAGTCTGSAATFTYEQALLHARSQPGWRLPNVKELSSLVDETRSFPAVDPIFPQTTANYFWTSSPLAGWTYYAWYVYFGYGGVSYNPRNNAYPVRLVR